uniref:Uncharacterized protein n=1 Tax=Brassica oleracea var. oleracea TaxID=109376 RepID=A0A0D3CHA7_BRAOL
YHRVPLVETNPWPPKTPQSESGRSRTRLWKFRLCAREVHAPPPENVATAGPPSPAAGISAVAAVDRRRFGVHLSSWRSYIPLLFIAKHPIPRWATPLLLTPPSFPLSGETDEQE